MNNHLSNGEEGFDIDMPNVNDRPDQASHQVQAQVPISTIIAVQNQPAQLQFPIMDIRNNNVPAVDFGAIAHGPIQISPAIAARRERMKKAILIHDKDFKVAWQKMPGHLRFGFHKELAKAETRAEPLEHWEKYLLFNNSDEDKIRVYRELATERYRERETLMVKLSDHLDKYEGLRSDMQMLRGHVFNLEFTVQQNELARQKMMGKIAELERSHLELSSGLDERVHLLNGKVDRKVQGLEGAVEKLMMGEDGRKTWEEEDDDVLNSVKIEYNASR